MPTVWVNGQADAFINPFDRGLAYGDGLFATMRVHKGEVQFIESHFLRLAQGALRLGFQWQPSTSLKQRLLQCAADHPQSCIKILLSRGVGGRGYMPVTSNPAINEIISVHPIPDIYANWQQAGINLQTADVLLARQPRLAGIKHCNRLEQVLIKSARLDNTADDWLVLDSQRNIIESSMANLFFHTETGIVTPKLSHAGVAGMMREQVIYKLLEMKFEVSITDFHIDLLPMVKHVFMTNSLLGVVDINKINQQPFKKAAYTSLLKEQLNLTL
ncbi:aminodeoxychorismate lyase [Shewanella youngdeokensis]|uniref:Aminodeoxychorismate lyase n=1 Tax=Shewanella youngdeokensis TaxID=2999068 RepID=A0ABZ0JW65_9GAMM|nr:aminodeoxychorismate lyase [Shewanella sp. DAU334]